MNFLLLSGPWLCILWLSLHGLVEPRQRQRVALLIAVASAVHLIALAIWNSYYPFPAGFGDDQLYFETAQRKFTQLWDWLDFTQFYFTQSYGVLEQGGYPLLLAWVYQFAGADLFLMKAVNILWLDVMALCWYWIASVLGGPRLARTTLVFVLGLPSAWLYFYVLLKDMTTAMLHSLFLVAVLRFYLGRRGIATYLGIFLPTILMLAFRAPVVVIHVAVLAVATMLTLLRQRGFVYRAITVLASIAIIGGVATLGSRADIASRLGIGVGSRLLTAEGLSQQIQFYRSWETSRSFGEAPDAVGFTIRMLVSDPGALSPRAKWEEPIIWRGINELPWILIGLPFFGWGLRALRRRRRRRTLARLWGEASLLSSSQDTSFQPLPPRMLRGILILISTYGVGFTMISWLTTETARWRLPIMPAFFLIAALGYCLLSRSKRVAILLSWLGAFVLAWSVIYGFIGVALQPVFIGLLAVALMEGILRHVRREAGIS